MLDYYPAKLIANGDKWYIRYYYRNPTTKKMERIRKTFQINRLKDHQERKKLGEQLCAQLNIDLANGFTPFIPTPTENLGAFNIVDALLLMRSIANNNSTSKDTKKTYKNVTNLFIRWLRQKSLHSLTIEEFGRRQAQMFVDDRAKQVSATTNNHQKMIISVFFNMLVDREYIVSNPFAKIKKLKEVETLRSFFSIEESKMIIEYLEANNPEFGVAVKLIYYCLMRPVEVSKLKIKYIDLENGKILLPAPITKSKRNCFKVIPEPFLKDLEYLKAYDPELFVFSTGEGYYPGDTRKPRKRFTEKHNRVLKHLGLHGGDKIRTFYSWKDTGVCRLVDAGINIRDIMEQCNHRNISTTQRYIKSLGYGASDKLRYGYPAI